MTILRSRTALLLLTCAALGTFSVGVSAREVRLQGPNGEGGTCPTAAATEAEVADPAVAGKRASTRAKAKAAPMSRSSGGGDGSDTANRPRWHSFLPGMFR